MVNNLINRFSPQMTTSDEVFGRVYYATSTCFDIIQTVTKVTRSIFISSLALVFLGKSPLLNNASAASWNDVGFSIRMVAYSVLGIFNPKLAWIKKCKADFWNNNFNFPELLLEEKGSKKSTALKIYLSIPMMESGIRYLSSYARFGIAEGLVALSRNQAQFVKVLSRDAKFSAKVAAREIDVISRMILD